MDEEEQRAVCELTRRWVEEWVVGLNLCPFARREVELGTIRFTVFPGDDGELDGLTEAVARELVYLDGNPEVETTLLIHPRALRSFLDYNDYLGVCEGLLEDMALVGVYQIASFHPDYCFADAPVHGPENYTNRSPYPMLHLLREDSVERAILGHPNIATVPENNVARLRALGESEVERRWRCYSPLL